MSVEEKNCTLECLSVFKVIYLIAVCTAMLRV